MEQIIFKYSPSHMWVLFARCTAHNTESVEYTLVLVNGTYRDSVHVCQLLDLDVHPWFWPLGLIS